MKPRVLKRRARALEQMARKRVLWARGLHNRWEHASSVNLRILLKMLRIAEARLRRRAAALRARARMSGQE